MKKIYTSLFLTGSLLAAQSQIIISGFLGNPASTDSPYEYVQLVATADINFATTPMAVVFAQNGTATASGWVAGGTLTYEMSLTSGSVSAGQTFYVGGSGKLINGSGSTDISGQTWIRAINTATTTGDLFGTAQSGGVVGNGGSNADGIGIFNSITLSASSVPIDAVFYGSAVASAFVSSSSGYTLPSNDLYSGGYLQTSSHILSDPGSAQFESLTGTYDAGLGTWTTSRTSTLISLTSSSSLSAIAPQITIVPAPEPTTLALAGLGLTALFGFRRNQKA